MNELLFCIQAGALFFSTRFISRSGEAPLLLWFCLQCLCANLFIAKEILLFGFVATAADAFAVGAFFALNYLRTFFGNEKAKAAIFYAFFLQLGFLVLTQFHIAFTPSPKDQLDPAFQAIFSLYPRVIGASLAAFFLSQRLDLFLFTKFSSLPFRSRIFITMTLSQTFDTLLFTLLALWGHISEMSGVILVSLAIKGILLIISTIFTGNRDDISLRTST